MNDKKINKNKKKYYIKSIKTKRRTLAKYESFIIIWILSEILSEIMIDSMIL